MTLRIEFVSRKAAWFELFLETVRKTATFEERVVGGTTIYSVEFRGPDEYLGFESFSRRLGDGRGVAYFIDKMPVDRWRALDTMWKTTEDYDRIQGTPAQHVERLIGDIGKRLKNRDPKE